MSHVCCGGRVNKQGVATRLVDDHPRLAKVLTRL